MKDLKDILKNKELVVSKTRRTEYGDMLDMFLEKINPLRVTAGYEPYTHARLANDLKRSGVKPSHLYILYQECCRVNYFSRYFFWSLRKRREALELKESKKLSTGDPLANK